MSSSFDKVILARILSTVNAKIPVMSVFVINYSFGVLILSTLNKICALLEQQGKKQKDLTDFLGISKNSFTDWKSGRIKSYNKHLPAIAEFLGVSTDYLLGRTENKNTATLFEQQTAFSFEGQQGDTNLVNNTSFSQLNDLLIAARELTPEQIELLTAMATNMKAK